MTMLIPILFSVLYLLACFGVASMAEKRKIGSQRSFHIAVILTPIVAFFAVVFSPKIPIHKFQLYRCKRCGQEYTDKHATCPTCAKEGLNIFVNDIIKKEVSLK